MNDPFDQDPFGQPEEPSPPAPAPGTPPGLPPEPGPPLAPPPGYGMRCHHCQADLSGAMLGGSCPACGAPITANHYGTSRSNGMAVASMVLGLVAIVGAPGGICCGCLAGVGLLCGILAVIFYFPAMNAIKNETAPPNSKGLALTGLICGIIGILLSLAYVGFFTFMIATNP